MKHALLPHDHGQNIETFLDRMPDNDEFIKVAEAFQQLGDGTRLKILCILCHSRECVSNIAAAVSMSNAAVSHHLQILKKAGIMKMRREGTKNYYYFDANMDAFDRLINMLLHAKKIMMALPDRSGED